MYREKLNGYRVDNLAKLSKYQEWDDANKKLEKRLAIRSEKSQ